MLKGHVFNLQTFTSEAFALFIDKFLNGRCGVAKGCELSNTANSATIGEGYFIVRGRPLQIISGETIANITENGYYNLICEIDLTKINTVSSFNQATIKIVSNTSKYPDLIQQDITGNGTKYQYLFAQFKVTNGTITDFTDKRTYVDFETIYDVIQNESQEVLNDIQAALNSVLDGSAYLLKTSYNAKITELESVDNNLNNKINAINDKFAVLTGTVTTDNYTINYPASFTKNNCVVISTMLQHKNNQDGSWATGMILDTSGYVSGSLPHRVVLKSNKILIDLKNIVILDQTMPNVQNNANTSGNFNFKIVLMKIA